MTTGFTKDVFKCCFRGGGKYNFNMSVGCVITGATVCHDSSAYLFGTAEWHKQSLCIASMHVVDNKLNCLQSNAWDMRNLHCNCNMNLLASFS